jgi:hypothetical protein
MRSPGFKSAPCFFPAGGGLLNHHTGRALTNPPSPYGGTFVPRRDRIGRETAPFGGLSKVTSRSQQRGLEAIEAAPPSRAVTLALGKNAREVALVHKAAELGNFGELQPRVLQEFLGALDALFGEPSVGWNARRLLKRPGEVAA